MSLWRINGEEKMDHIWSAKPQKWVLVSHAYGIYVQCHNWDRMRSETVFLSQFIRVKIDFGWAYKIMFQWVHLSLLLPIKNHITNKDIEYICISTCYVTCMIPRYTSLMLSNEHCSTPKHSRQANARNWFQHQPYIICNVCMYLCNRLYNSILDSLIWMREIIDK